MKKPSELSIRRKYLRFSLTILLFVLLIGAGSYLYMKNQQVNMIEQRQELFEKQEVFEELRDSLQDLFFRFRGYAAFQNEDERTQAYEDLNNVHAALNNLDSVSLTAGEAHLINELRIFLQGYEQNFMPDIIALVNAKDYDALAVRTSSGTTDAINVFTDEIKQRKAAMDEQLEQQADAIINQANDFIRDMMIFIFAIFMLVGFIIWRTVNDIVKPIELMRKAADNFSLDQRFSFIPLKRNDEIGVLSSSFSSMLETIHDKEDSLTAQNEELLKQQAALQEHQAKLEESLQETERTKEQLERYNSFNHVLSFTLNKQELAESVLRYFDDVYQIDMGLFWLPQTSESAIKGMTADMCDDFMENRLEYIQNRLAETPFFMIKREAAAEKGLAHETVFTYDFYAGVQNAESQLVAMMGLSRIGRPFTPDEQQNVAGMLNRVHLAVDRIQLYDQAVHERMLNEQIVNNIHEGIQFVSQEGSVLQFNEALAEIFALNASELHQSFQSKQWPQLLAAKTTDSAQMQTFLDKCLQKNNHEFHQYRYTVAEPSERVVVVYSGPVLRGSEKLGTIFVHRDITQEHEVDRMKTELVSTVSHELRTPLSSVLGFTELLLHKELKPEKQKRYLETIYKEAKRLTNLINDFLDLQRMESGNQAYQMEKVAVNQLVVDATAQFRMKTSHKLVVIDEAADIFVEGDRERLTQVLINLLSNAIKFSPQGGDVTVTLKNENGRLSVSIADQGIGIPAEDIPKLFSKFQRIDNGASRKIGGTGLGLAICREIIEKHNGTVSLESEEGNGTTITVTLPVLAASGSRTIKQGENNNNPAVMIVEDDMSLALLLSEELKMNGFKVIYHTNPSDAFEEALRTPFVGIVVDIMLGDDISGWDLVRMLKEEKRTKDIPVVISSALDPEFDNAVFNEIDDYLTKPYPPKKLSETIIRFLEEPAEESLIFYPDKQAEANQPKQ